ncbi:hypothetical protein D3C71_1926000 [compost metagenome]
MPHAGSQGSEAVAYLRVSRQTIDDFHHFHQRHRVKKMKASDALGKSAIASNAGDGER